MKKFTLVVLMLFTTQSYAQGEQLYAGGTATDQEGNNFEWINYGTQDWAIETAEVVAYRDGTAIPQVTSSAEWQNLTTGAWCYFDNDPSKEKLYNWYAVAGIHDNEVTTPNKEFAPEGWHVPTDAEWSTLENHLIATGYNYDGTTTEDKIAKSMAATTGWDERTDEGVPGNNSITNNTSGFNAYPVGFRSNNGVFVNQNNDSPNFDGGYAILWSSTPTNTGAFYRDLDGSDIDLDRASINKGNGATVRFVRGASSVGATGILLNGTVSAENHQIKNVADPTEAQDAVTLAYINQLESSNEDLQEQVDDLETKLQAQIDEIRNLENWSDSDGDGFTEFFGDCNDSDEFTYPGAAQNESTTECTTDLDGDGFGDIAGINPGTDCNDSDASINPRIYEVSDGIDNDCDGEIDEGYNGFDDVIDIDGNNYNFAIYGDQVWTVENAEMVTYRDGTEIPQVTDETEWANLTTGAWCYYNNDPSKGKLYNWYAVAGIHDAIENTPNKEFAPEGWHVPSDAEWTTLEEYLIANEYNYDGSSTENKIAKAMAATTGWNSSTELGAIGNNQSLNNISGFNAFPEGFRVDYGDSFDVEGTNAIFWSSTESNTDNFWLRYLSSTLSDLSRTSVDGRYGFSVRFVRD
jgi:uncharacterized protein (TIGR02145 family)